MELACDDVIREILVRLPHAWHVFRCTTVCKRWRSLISDYSFIARFIKHPRQPYLPFTLLFKTNYTTAVHPLSFEHSQTNSVYYYPSLDPCSYLNFAPPTCNTLIGSSSHGLLLFLGSDHSYLLCDPTIRVHVRVPPMDTSFNDDSLLKRGLVCDHDGRGGFVLSKLGKPSIVGSNYVFPLQTFRSKEGSWETSTVVANKESDPKFYRFLKGTAIATPNGFNHFIYLHSGDKFFRGIFAFRPSDQPKVKRGSFIKWPRDFVKWDPRAKHCWGVTNGRFRLVQCLVYNKYYTLKIWDLRYDNDNIGSASWVVVYGGKLRPNGRTANSPKYWYVEAVHPSKDNVVFVVNNGKKVYEYDFIEEKCNFVDQVSSQILGSYTLCHSSCLSLYQHLIK